MRTGLVVHGCPLSALVPSQKVLRTKGYDSHCFGWIISDTRKLTSVILYSDNRHFIPYISNIQLETTNYLLQGGPLPDVIADMIDNLGHAFREFARTKGKPAGTLYRYGLGDWEASAHF
uniref:Uncharacterized protein n=1 Tax=Ditylenchus dipsaci TaxID=166011 RepID=A0A915DP97_9BILA